MYFGWKPYVPVAKRRQQAERAAAKLKKSGEAMSPVTAGRGAIATTFWGKAWCQNLERYSDYSNRLPRGRTYLRNGSVIDLQITAGQAQARVMGSSLYRISVKISAVPFAQWQRIAQDCARSIDSWVELLEGRLSTAVMERITRPGAGLFPSPKEVTFNCSCPDSAAMCKHVAATLYGIGARLDAEPELLFGLRKVDAKELIARAGEDAPLARKRPAAARLLDSAALAGVFGIDLASTAKLVSGIVGQDPQAVAQAPAKAIGSKEAAVIKRKRPDSKRSVKVVGKPQPAMGKSISKTRSKTKIKVGTQARVKSKSKSKPQAKIKTRAHTSTKATRQYDVA